MLRESATLLGTPVDLNGISDSNCKVIDDVPHSEALLRFCDTFLGGDDDAFAAARDSLAEQMGPAAMVDVAGIAANFQRMDRIADAIGIPADAPMVLMQEEFVDQLGLQNYASASNTPKLSWPKRQLTRFLLLPALRRMIASRNAGA